jgi:hypothetical protein
MASNESLMPPQISNMSSPLRLEEGSSWTSKFMMVIFVVALLVGLYYLRPYFTYIQSIMEMVRSVLLTTIDLASNTSTNVVDGTVKGSDVVIKKISGAKTKKEPAPDESNSTMQKKNTNSGGYCYLGEWKGLRSCARVGAEDCTSGEMFGSKELCMNPELR